MVDLKNFDYIEELPLNANDFKVMKSADMLYHRKTKSSISSLKSLKQIHLSSARLLKHNREKSKVPEEVKPFCTPMKKDLKNRNSREVFQQIFDRSTTADVDRVASKIARTDRKTSTKELFRVRPRSSLYDPNLQIRSTEDFNELARKIDSFTIKTNLLPRLTAEDTTKVQSLFRKGQSSEFFKMKKTFNKTTDPDFFTLFKKKKPVKNFPKKKQLYNLDAEKILQHEYKPLKEFLKKNLTYTKEAVDREIQFEFLKPFMIVNQNKFSERFRASNEVIEHERRCLLRSQIKEKEDKQHIEKLDNIFIDHDLIQSNFKLNPRTTGSNFRKAKEMHHQSLIAL
jgi:hypothetical protein